MKKIVTMGLSILVLSMIFSGMQNQTFAQSDPYSLVKIATQARDHIKLELERLDVVNEEVKELYTKASSDTDLLIEAVELGDITSAKEHFMSAMKNFKSIGDKLTVKNLTAEQALDQSTKPSIGLNTVIERMESYVEKLKDVSNRYDSDISFVELDELINTAKNNIKSGDSDQALKTIDKLKTTILEVYESLKDESDKRHNIRAKNFAETYVNRVDTLISQAKDLDLPLDTIERLEQSRVKLHSTTDSDQIIKQVKIIISIKEKFEEAKINRTDAVIKQIEERLNRLSNIEDVSNSSEYDKAEKMLVELKNLLSEGNFKEAIPMIHSLKILMKEIENSTGKKEIVLRDMREKPMVDSLSDSKSDRIKIKIQKLEDEIINLLEQIEDDNAATRLLEHSLSILDDAKPLVDESPSEALELIKDVEMILKRVRNFQ